MTEPWRKVSDLSLHTPEGRPHESDLSDLHPKSFKLQEVMGSQTAKTVSPEVEVLYNFELDWTGVWCIRKVKSGPASMRSSLRTIPEW
jgi:hypothetical protein